MTLNDIFTAIVMQGDTVSLPLDSKQTYETLRVSLVRKFSAYKKQCADFDLESYDDMYISCSFNKESLEACFKLKHKADSARVPKQYGITRL